MGFKTDTSFLRFLTMGAIGVRQAIHHLQQSGFQPIELERYCSSNKLWATKVKRLRLPDILCARTGLRVEVRAKSDLKIRMSDAPANPERTWDAGQRDDDITAFIAISEDEAGLRAAALPVYFRVDSLRQSVGTSRLGPPKSASEGAERDRTWPSVVPSRSGTVQSVTEGRLTVEFNDADGPARRQTYSITGKHPYVQPQDTFVAGASILAGTPPALADIGQYIGRAYAPIVELQSASMVDRYSAAKAIRYRQDLNGIARQALETALAIEADDRVKLEIAGTLAALDAPSGRETIEATLDGNGRADLRMEAILILTELGGPFARDRLRYVLSANAFSGNEIRQAAVWGLGKTGLKTYGDLVPYIADPDENVAMHAIVGFSADTPDDVVALLIDRLINGSPRQAAAASEALRQIANGSVVAQLVGAAGRGPWVIATLGRLPPALVLPAVEGTQLKSGLEPMFLLEKSLNWLGSEEHISDIAFLSKQTLG